MFRLDWDNHLGWFLPCYRHSRLHLHLPIELDPHRRHHRRPPTHQNLHQDRRSFRRELNHLLGWGSRRMCPPNCPHLNQGSLVFRSAKYRIRSGSHHPRLRNHQHRHRCPRRCHGNHRHQCRLMNRKSMLAVEESKMCMDNCRYHRQLHHYRHRCLQNHLYNHRCPNRSKLVGLKCLGCLSN